MKLAVLGGEPVRRKPFSAHNNIDAEEKDAVARVLDSGVLSRYLGCFHENFYGGGEVRALEDEWAEYFGSKYAVAVNSCTSGLYCAVGAAGVEPEDEIIVSPYTMSASATAPLIFNAVPIFADIEQDYFCLDPKSVEERITPKTRAIIVVDIFGLPYDVAGINALAEKHGLLVIEDAAQAPGAKYKDKFAGALADIGVYSLNYHKHIHCGEGGVIVTDDAELANKVRLIRNHAEAVVEGMERADIVNMIGFNFRLPELEAAITRCQLQKLEALLEKRHANIRYLEERLATIPALQLPKVREDCVHAYYLHAIRFDEDVAGVSRDLFVNAVQQELPPFELRETEGVKIGGGYVKPLYLQPLFQQRLAYGAKGYPFQRDVGAVTSYEKGICPVVEHMHERELITHEFMLPSMNYEDLNDVVNAFCKVWEQRKILRSKKDR